MSRAVKTSWARIYQNNTVWRFLFLIWISNPPHQFMNNFWWCCLFMARQQPLVILNPLLIWFDAIFQLESILFRKRMESIAFRFYYRISIRHDENVINSYWKCTNCISTADESSDRKHGDSAAIVLSLSSSVTSSKQSESCLSGPGKSP